MLNFQFWNKWLFYRVIQWFGNESTGADCLVPTLPPPASPGPSWVQCPAPSFQIFKIRTVIMEFTWQGVTGLREPCIWQITNQPRLTIHGYLHFGIFHCSHKGGLQQWQLWEILLCFALFLTCFYTFFRYRVFISLCQ